MKTDAEVARQAHRRFDTALARLLEKARQEGEVPPCRAGCAWCCSEPMYANRQEAVLIAERIRTWPEARQARIRERLRQWMFRFTASGLQHEPEPHVMAYRHAGLACPLLDLALCSVYLERPLGCRSHMARRDATKCDNDRVHQEFLLTHELLVLPMRDLIEAGAEADYLALLLYRELIDADGPHSAAWILIRRDGDTIIREQYAERQGHEAVTP